MFYKTIYSLSKTSFESYFNNPNIPLKQAIENILLNKYHPSGYYFNNPLIQNLLMENIIKEVNNKGLNNAKN